MSTETTPVKPAEPTPQPNPRNGKPVFIYIMILFIAAFFLMALSFLMHQRSNSEALGQLETSFHSTIEDMQSSQERILQLEKDLEEAKDALSSAETQLADLSDEQAASEALISAMEQLYCLQQSYSAGNYEACASLIAEMEATGSADALSPVPVTVGYGYMTAPYVRFQQLKAGTQEKLAELEEK